MRVSSLGLLTSFSEMNERSIPPDRSLSVRSGVGGT